MIKRVSKQIGYGGGRSLIFRAELCQAFEDDEAQQIAVNVAELPELLRSIEPASVTKNRGRRDRDHRTNRHIVAETAKPPGLGQ